MLYLYVSQQTTTQKCQRKQGKCFVFFKYIQVDRNTVKYLDGRQ